MQVSYFHDHLCSLAIKYFRVGATFYLMVLGIPGIVAMTHPGKGFCDIMQWPLEPMVSTYLRADVGPWLFSAWFIG